jgi:hypothetical protein
MNEAPFALPKLRFFAAILLFSTSACVLESATEADALEAEDPAESAPELASTSEALVCDHTSAPFLPSDPGYRVVAYPSTDGGNVHPMPAPSKSWTLTYKYVVPALPCGPNWNHNTGTFYIWGDVDFDPYGAYGGYPLSSYLYNQIVPQLTIGYALTGNDAEFHPSWTKQSGWVIQAQYFWMHQDGNFYAQTGKIVKVKPGQTITTTIKYSASTGSMAVKIASPSASSSITIARPFPNEPNLFASWRDFFEKGVAQSQTLYARPQMNVESHFVDQDTMCSVLPWNIGSFSVPGTKNVGSNFTAVQYGDYSCPAGQYANFNF